MVECLNLLSGASSGLCSHLGSQSPVPERQLLLLVVGVSVTASIEAVCVEGCVVASRVK